MSKSILQKDYTRCFICKQNPCGDPLDKHHVFGGALRKKSEHYGLTIYVHHEKCHVFGRYAVHVHPEVDQQVKAFAQKKAMKQFGWSEEDFRDLFYKSYI